MRRRTAASAVAALVLAALCGGMASTTLRAASATLTDPTTGKPVAVEPGARALHLVFFATWCPTCVDELARLGEEIGRDWCSPLTSREILSEMRR